jgi:hypothetical protein
MSEDEYMCDFCNRVYKENILIDENNIICNYCLNENKKVPPPFTNLKDIKTLHIYTYYGYNQISLNSRYPFQWFPNVLFDNNKGKYDICMDELEILEEKVSSRGLQKEVVNFCNSLQRRCFAKMLKSINSLSLCLKYKNICKDIRIYIAKISWKEKADFSWFKILENI